MSSEIQALSSGPDHISSFVASAMDGSITDSSIAKEECQKQAHIALSMLQDTQQLLSKGISESHDGTLKRIVVTFPDHFYGFAVEGEKILGTKRRIEA
ncbi:hypothetical protein VKS41_008374 [Umbelopsis sp. WA50703]